MMQKPQVGPIRLEPQECEHQAKTLLFPFMFISSSNSYGNFYKEIKVLITSICIRTMRNTKKCIEIWILSGYSPSREMCIIQFCALAEQLLHDLVLS